MVLVQQLRTLSPQDLENSMTTIYLAGPIRDSAYEEDVAWREYLIKRIQGKYIMDVKLLNPLGNKTFNPETHIWKVGGLVTQAKGIVAQDLWSVRQADIIIANLTAMNTGYPAIGTVMEMGAAAGIGGKLVYTVLDPGSNPGNENKGVFKLHPFLEQVSTEIFPSVDALWGFLDEHLGMLTGQQPSFGGVSHAA
jgi:nucleoside 2-deoxyribosyltransferase